MGSKRFGSSAAYEVRVVMIAINQGPLKSISLFDSNEQDLFLTFDSEACEPLPHLVREVETIQISFFA